MASLATKYLPILILLFFSSANSWALPSSDSDLSDAIQKKDWPQIILLLQPKKGQNFEHDLTLAKAFLSLERRAEALKLLSSLVEVRKDERAIKLFQSAGTLFFTQETSTQYYEALDLIKTLKFAEAKERLDQALVKEPGHVLLLTRLVQVEMLLQTKDQALIHLKLAQANSYANADLRLFAAKMTVENTLSDTDDENDSELYRQLLPYRLSLLENEITLTYWAEAVLHAAKMSELEQLANKILKEHAAWTYSLVWFLKKAEFGPVLQAKLKTQIDKNLKDRALFDSVLDLEMKKTDYLWVGYVSFDALTLQAKATPTPVPSP